MSSPDAAVASNSRDDAKIADAQLQQQIEKDAADVSSTIPSDTGDTSAAGGAEGTSLRLENISRYESEESTPNLTPTSPSLVSAIKGSQKFRKKKSMRVSFSRDLIEERDHTPYIENTQTETDFYDNSDGGIHIPRDYLNSPHSSKSKVPMFAGEDAFYSPSTASSRSDHNSARNKLEETVRDNVLRFHDMLRGKGPNAPASFRDRVMLARTTEEMCIVFGINTVGVFNGEMMQKKFSKDFMVKDSIIWIDPSSMTLHWAKPKIGRNAWKSKYIALGSDMDASTEDSNTPTDAQDKQVFLDNSNGEVVGTPIGDDSPTAATDSPLQSKTETEGDVDGENVEDVAQPSSDVIQVASGNVSQKSSRKPKGFSRGKIKSLEVFGLSIFVETDAGEKLDLKILSNGIPFDRLKDWVEVIKKLSPHVE